MFHPQHVASLAIAVVLAASNARADSADANFSLDHLPNTWQDGQSGTDQCDKWMPSSQDSLCQVAFINSSRSPGLVGDTERDEVAWCTKPGYGTRLIPDGTLHSVHFVKTPTYVQITGTGDFTKMNILPGDAGGELDPHGADGNGNPIGGLVYTNAFNGQYQQIHQWTNFMSANEYCFKACIDADDAETQCAHQFDLQGCMWNMPGSYGDGFEQCDGDIAQYPGIYGTSTYYQNEQGDNAPPPHAAPASYNCKAQPSPVNGGGGTPVLSTSSAAPAAATPAPAAPAASSPSSASSPPPNGAAAAQAPGDSRVNGTASSSASSNHKVGLSSVLVRCSAGVAGLAALAVLLA
ncbi:unnamed protein product [Tilletia controversa]|nr:unnamed protein product [Tilletia controversa]CAD6924599.1 unnamed protein product [Tilletia controversa]CAD6954086.1 unnamed protein product [Tilletia controversa]CAD6976359.1 unnamed protein product [Tilletia controversa]CAD6977483.1 unnamed protein product [Tilletia controversa]